MLVSIDVSQEVIKELIANTYDVTTSDVELGVHKTEFLGITKYHNFYATVKKDIPNELLVKKENEE